MKPFMYNFDVSPAGIDAARYILRCRGHRIRFDETINCVSGCCTECGTRYQVLPDRSGKELIQYVLNTLGKKRIYDRYLLSFAPFRRKCISNPSKYLSAAVSSTGMGREALKNIPVCTRLVCMI